MALAALFRRFGLSSGQAASSIASRAGASGACRGCPGLCLQSVCISHQNAKESASEDLPDHCYSRCKRTAYMLIRAAGIARLEWSSTALRDGLLAERRTRPVELELARRALITTVTSLSMWERILPISVEGLVQATTSHFWDSVTTQEIYLNPVGISNLELHPLAAMLTW
jgi:hypothetical protein